MQYHILWSWIFSDCCNKNQCRTGNEGSDVQCDSMFENEKQQVHPLLSNEIKIFFKISFYLCYFSKQLLGYKYLLFGPNCLTKRTISCFIWPKVPWKNYCDNKAQWTESLGTLYKELHPKVDSYGAIYNNTKLKLKRH